MATYSKIAQGLRESGVTGTTNDIVSNWLKGKALVGTTPDMLFTYLRSTGLVGTLSDMLSTYVFSAVTPVTDGMTLTASWTDFSTGYNDLVNAVTASVRVDVTINTSTDSGVLMESGGTGSGLVLYVYAGVLYFQCGNGGAFGTTADTAEVSYTLPAGEFDYVIEWSADVSNAVLYVNGVNVDSQLYSNSELGGADLGKSGGIRNSCAVNRGGWAGSSQGVYTNTNAITKCDIFLNQVTSDV